MAAPISSSPRRSLAVVYDDIEARARAITAGHDDWPCRRGCSDCCRGLAAPPIATRAEWEHFWRGFTALDPATRTEIRARVSALAPASEPPHLYVCPMLDRDAGACLVYEHRPGACRAYGFYAARDGGRWCGRIEAIAQGAPNADDRDQPAIIWGNHGALDDDLRALSAPADAAIELGAWFAAHPDDPDEHVPQGARPAR